MSAHKRPLDGVDDGSATPLAFARVADLNGNSENWTLKVVVVDKDEQLKQYSNANGSGSYFKADLADASLDLPDGALGPVIRASAFNEAAAKWFGVLQRGGAYLVSNAKVKKKKAQFNRLPGDYELSLDADSQIIALAPASVQGGAEAAAAKKLRLEQESFLTLEQAKDQAPGTPFNVVVCVRAMQPTAPKTLPGKEPLDMRVIYLVDHSRHEIAATLWGGRCEAPWVQQDALLVMRRVQTRDYKDKRSLSLAQGSRVELATADCEAARPLLEWRAGLTEQQLNDPFYFVKISKDDYQRPVEVRLNCAQARELLDAGGAAFSAHVRLPPAPLHGGPAPALNLVTRASLVAIKREGDRALTFQACVRCRSRASADGNGGFLCSNKNCNQNTLTSARAFIVVAAFSDYSGSVEATLFNDQVVAMLAAAGENADITADDVHRMHLLPGTGQPDHEAMTAWMAARLRFQEYLITLRESKGRRGEEGGAGAGAQRVNFVVSQITRFYKEADIKREERQLLQLLDQGLD